MYHNPDAKKITDYSFFFFLMLESIIQPLDSKKDGIIHLLICFISSISILYSRKLGKSHVKFHSCYKRRDTVPNMFTKKLLICPPKSSQFKAMHETDSTTTG